MSVGFSLRYDDWLRGWREWARTRKRGKMAQFIVEKLEEGNQAQWLDIENGLFELTEWHSIAKEWFGEKPRNSEQVDAPCMLRKGLPRAFPGLDEIKEKSRKEGTQYRSRVFKAPQSLMNDVLLHITNNAGQYLQNGRDQMMPSYSPYPNPVFNVSGTTESAAVTTVPTYFGGNSHHHQMVENVFTNPTTNVEMDMQHPNAEYNRFVGNNYEGPNYMTQQGPYSNDDIDRYVQRITENGSDGTNSTTSTNYNPASTTSTSTTNGLYNNYTSPASMLGVPSPVGFQPKEEMGSPSSGPPPYSTSPASTHSPRISPEPSMMGSYPPSVQQSNIITGSEMSPSAQISTSPAVPIEPELMKVKANPNSSPIEVGGGHLVLLFYNPLPLGKKMVVFCSQKSRDLMYAQEAVQENMMALICQIPEYPYPEEVQLQVYNYNQIIARTTFVFYQQSLPMHPPSDMILQILSSQLQSHFPNGGMGGANGGRSNGDQMSGSGGYSSYIPNSMYHLLLGACRLGCEPLVHCLLSSPVMEDLTQEQMKEAYECALSNGHESLSEVLMELVVLHEMAPTITSSTSSSSSSHGYISRGLSNGQSEQVQHVPAYYAVLDELQQGGNSPQARAETVLKQLLTAMKEKAKDEPEKQNEGKEEVKEEPVADTQPEVEDVTTPIIEITPNLTVDKLTVKMEETTLSPKRRLSSTAILKRQSNSISDEDDELHHSDLTLQSPAVFHSRESWAEVNDTVSDLVSHKKKHPYTQQSDADSAIGMSFEEELSSLVNSEMQRRRSSLMLPPDMFSQHNDSITINMTTDVGIEVANGLEWEGCIVVTEDYPPGQDKKILCKGDRIVQVGDKLIRGMSAVDFSELFQSEATNGANIRIIPANNTTQQLPLETSPMPQQRILKRTPSEQFSDGIKTKINQLISIRPSSVERHVTLSRSSSSGYPIKMIGGKTVGVFISDVRSDVTQVQVYPGDEILEINGHSTRGLTLYDANQIVQTTSGDLRLSVIENKAKFFHVREQVEIDSMYLRSRIDYKPISNREMTLQKGSLLRVVNTCSLTNSWVAWSIDEITGVEIQLKKILPPTIAKMQFGCDAYERVERSDSLFKRPLCVTGPDSDSVAELVSGKPQFNLCENFEQMLGICSQSTDRAVMSIKDPAHLELLKALQPIVFQTPLDSAPLLQQSKFSQVSVNMFLTGQTSSELAQEAITQMHRLQDLPIFKPVGVI